MSGFEDLRKSPHFHSVCHHELMRSSERVLSFLRSAGAVFFDLKDAFGSVNRRNLLYKLCRDFQVSSRLLMYIRNFLSTRCARIKVNDLIGDWLESEWGTSAGTAIGPILFIAYAHDTPASIQLKFADDMVGYASGVNEFEVQLQLQQSIVEISQWAKKWDLELNASKTKSVLFGHSTVGKIQLQLNGISIEQVTEFKYLGVILDEQLKFESQAEYSASKARRALNRLCCLIDGRKGISVKLCIELYKCLVRPHLEYAVPAWATTTEMGLKLLEKVQGECLRRIMGAKLHSSIDSLNVIANVLPVRLRIQELCTRDYMLVLQKPADGKIRTLLSTAVAIRNKFTPMSYIKYLAHDFERSLGNMEIEKEDKVTTDVILDDIAVQLLPLAQDLGNRNNRTQEQKVEGKLRVDSFVEQNRGSSVMVFSDGSM